MAIMCDNGRVVFKSKESQWIKVSERMPQERTTVWIYIDGNVVASYYNGVCWTIGNSILKSEFITHWMEYKIPEPPFQL